MADYTPLSEKEYAGILSKPLDLYPVYDQVPIIKATARLNPALAPEVKDVGRFNTDLIAKVGKVTRDFPEAKDQSNVEWVQSYVPYVRMMVVEPSLNPKHNLYPSGKSWLDSRVVGLPVAVTPGLGYFILDQYETFLQKMAERNCAPGPSAAYCFAFLIARLVVAYPMLLDKVNDKGHFDSRDSMARHLVSAVHKGTSKDGFQWNPAFNPKDLTNKLAFPMELNHARSVSRFLHVDLDHSHDTQFAIKKDQVKEGYGLGSHQGEKRFNNLINWRNIEGSKKGQMTYHWDTVRAVLETMGLMAVTTEADYWKHKTFTFEPGPVVTQFVDSYMDKVDAYLHGRLMGRPRDVKPLGRWLTNLKGSNRVLPNAIYAFAERGQAVMVFSSQLPYGESLVANDNLTGQPGKLYMFHDKNVPIKACTMLRRVSMVQSCVVNNPTYKEISDNINLSTRPVVPVNVKAYIRMLSTKSVRLPVNDLLAELSWMHHTSGDAISSGAFRTLARMINPENLGCQQGSSDRHNQIVMHRAHHFTTLRSPRINSPVGFGSLPNQLKQVILTKSGYVNYDVKSCHPMLIGGLVKRYRKELIETIDEYGKVFLTDRDVDSALTIFGMYESKTWTDHVLTEMEDSGFKGLLESALVMVRNPWRAGVYGAPKWSGSESRWNDRLALHQVWKSAGETLGQTWRKEKEFIRVIDGVCKLMFLSVMYGSSLKTSHESILKSSVVPDTIDKLIRGLVAPIELELNESHVQALKIKMMELAIALIYTTNRLIFPVIRTMQALPSMILAHPDYKVTEHVKLPVNRDLIAKHNYFLYKSLSRSIKDAGLDPDNATASAVSVRNALGSVAFFYTDKMLNGWTTQKEKSKLLHFITCGMEQAVMIEFNMRHKDIVVAQEHDGVMLSRKLTRSELKEFTQIALDTVGVPLVLAQKDFT
ncbi:hypothetical protein KoPa5_00165 [Pseudomonas phage vB_PpuM-KoPa-5]